MQTQQVKNECAAAEQYIEKAARLCQTSGNAPEELRNAVAALEQESQQARTTLAEEQNDNKIIACVDQLEKLADRAMQACRQGSNIDEQLQQAVEQAHGVLSDIKHRVHEPAGA